jgi:hypothetical protein
MPHTWIDYEREFIGAASQAFAGRAQVTRQYLTHAGRHAEPDLLLVPWAGRYSNVPHLVEFKFSRMNRLDELAFVAAMRAVGRLKSVNPDLRGAIVTNASLSTTQLDAAERNDISVFPGVEDRDKFIYEIGRWLGLR